MSASRVELLDLMVRYMVSLRERGFSATVAQRKLAGVRFYTFSRGNDDVTRDFLIRQVLKGWRKEIVRKVCRRPITHL